MNESIIITSKYQKKNLIYDLIGIVIILILAVSIFYLLRQPLISLFIAAIISYLLLPIVDRIERLGITRVIVVSIAFLVIGAILVIGVFNLGPLLISQIDTIQKKLPEYKELSLNKIAYIKDKLYYLQSSFQKRFPIIGEIYIVENLLDSMSKTAVNGFNELLSISTVFSVISILPLFIFVPFITFFLLLKSRAIKKYLISLVPNRYFEVSLNFLHRIDSQLRNYLGGMIIECFIIGTLSATGLYFLNVNYFLFIGIIAGIVNVVPYLGPLIGSSLAIIVVLLESGNLTDVFQVLILFITIRLIDDLLIIPIVISNAVKIHPVIVLLAILVGEHMMGIIGMILAVPVYEVIKIILKEIQGIIYRHHLT
ncbi:MAG: hypothetical protein A3C43_08210 [Candidatus Schekmanbacteria bacterium RIFCSPHIGHO2_02_FULL_38_11]|uniref:AI-2E family transporter n=1 Tax=Candidatus Schekmanbacteria bacterium RIFCSPLOWO2_12_FULL_38_15 TaxID=1817883 RepID=A0A1F7SDF2_9BACT|nr:MAG: hypothetical protein A2043_07485 [Candidatus Schekmanbacteria bacterium GWA2_38_9]OGL49971.1 MAG: hypothetical protein A3H37_12150 [Candidatus Schekmanbacteria bacterium RIFCSPLOWO2_02_FULL_38_14]OGL51809.1 MAG: hypothetical protein A3G31_12555 [Candidatus Schekmanbacteria bacterium RIFCSPLOWO2_12_FULL_38_15]OGL54608.1 MAG: hypothetical protein A3C43_08210 [Candidatus Schekmanbacteria bacterium RIFCSPHIGHO2_02_FULL_38_11]